MTITSHFETSFDRISHKLGALISDLRRTVQYLDIDIQVEEFRAGVSDVQSMDYPNLARNLRVRRDNLLATITLLEREAGAIRSYRHG